MAVADLQRHLTEVRAAKEDRKADAAERYHRLIIASADGLNIDPSEAALTFIS